MPRVEAMTVTATDRRAQRRSLGWRHCKHKLRVADDRRVDLTNDMRGGVRDAELARLGCRLRVHRVTYQADCPCARDANVLVVGETGAKQLLRDRRSADIARTGGQDGKVAPR